MLDGLAVHLPALLLSAMASIQARFVVPIFNLRLLFGQSWISRKAFRSWDPCSVSMTKSDRSYGYRRPPKLQRRDLMFISLFLGPAPERLKFNPWRGAEALPLVCIVQELLTIVPLGFRYSMFSFSRHNLKERRTSSSKPACLVSPSSLLMQAALARPFARDRQALSFPSRSQRP